ncbi:MAG: BCD family MFS transporter [Pseudomonadota bacterium]
MTESRPPDSPAEGDVVLRVPSVLVPTAEPHEGALPVRRLLRLSLFQVSVGAALALTAGALNRVLIVEIGAPAALVSVMLALPILFAPLRALIGHKSDEHKSPLGWRRTPYIWIGTILLFGGLSIMPFALIVFSGDQGAPVAVGRAAVGLAFLLIGAGGHLTQTAGLALACDITAESQRPRAVAMMYVTLLLGMFASSLIYGALLIDFSPVRLIQVIQGVAGAALLFNLIALWKQETWDRDRARAATTEPSVPFREAWRAFAARPGAKRYLTAVGLGTAAFGMQDILLEPYGGEVLGLSVAATTFLTAIFTAGALAAFALAARLLTKGWDPYRLAAYGALLGLPGFAFVALAAPLEAPLLLRTGAFTLGLGNGVFAVATLTAIMGFDQGERNGLALGAWGAVQATTAGVAMAVSGPLRDGLAAVAASGWMGPGLAPAAAGYLGVFHLEIFLILAALAAIGPLARSTDARRAPLSSDFGLHDAPI